MFNPQLADIQLQNEKGTLAMGPRYPSGTALAPLLTPKQKSTTEMETHGPSRSHASTQTETPFLHYSEAYG